MKQIVFNIRMMSVIVALLLAGCSGSGSNGDSGTVYACSYQQRTSGCNNYAYGAWKPGCLQFNSADLVVTPQQYCSNYTKGGLYCASTCCIDTQFKTVALNAGTCP